MTRREVLFAASGALACIPGVDIERSSATILTADPDEDVVCLVVRIPNARLRKEQMSQIEKSVSAKLAGGKFKNLPVFVCDADWDIGIEKVKKSDLANVL